MINNYLLRKGIKVLYKELGPIQTIEFFQRLGINEGDSVKEIETITEKMSKEEVMECIKKTRKQAA